ncbi:hypothetical protein MKX47_12085 [Solibacillus sp. FSL R7-0668]
MGILSFFLLAILTITAISIEHAVKDISKQNEQIISLLSKDEENKKRADI